MTTTLFEVTRDAFKVTEIAKMLGVSERTAWRWISDGRLRARQLGGRITRVLAEDLKAFLDANPRPLSDSPTPDDPTPKT